LVVRPYFGNKYENNLAKLKMYLLKHVLNAQDVRDLVRKDFLKIMPPLPSGNVLPIAPSNKLLIIPDNNDSVVNIPKK